MHKCAGLLFLIATGCSQASSPTDTPTPTINDAAEAARSIVEGIPGLAAGEIYYQRTGCFGACPDFSFVIRPDGRGVYTGARFVKHEGEYPFTVSPDEYEWFKASLEAYRAEGERDYGEDNCPFGPVPTDGSSVRVSWGPGDTLLLYDGCAVEDLPQDRAITQSWRRLDPVVALVGNVSLEEPASVRK